MLRKLFNRRPQIVEVMDSNGQRKTMSKDEFISKAIAERQLEADRFRLGLSNRREQDRHIEYSVGRWTI